MSRLKPIKYLNLHKEKYFKIQIRNLTKRSPSVKYDLNIFSLNDVTRDFLFYRTKSPAMIQKGRRLYRLFVIKKLTSLGWPV